MIATSETDVLKMISVSLKHKESLFKLYNSLAALGSSTSQTPRLPNNSAAVVASPSSVATGKQPPSFSRDSIVVIALWRLLTQGSLFYSADLKTLEQCAYIHHLNFAVNTVTPSLKSMEELFTAKPSMLQSGDQAAHSATSDIGGTGKGSGGSNSMEPIDSVNDTLCPYELLGSCSDATCKYRHFSSYKATTTKVLTSASSIASSSNGNPPASSIIATKITTDISSNSGSNSFISSSGSGSTHNNNSNKSLASLLPQLITSFKSTAPAVDKWVIEVIAALIPDSELVAKVSVRSAHCHRNPRSLLEALLVPLFVDPFAHAVTVDRLLNLISSTLLVEERKNLELWQLFLQLTTMIKSGNSGRRNPNVLDALMIPSLLSNLPTEELLDGVEQEHRQQVHGKRKVVAQLLLHFATPEVLEAYDPVLATLLKLETHCVEFCNIETVLNFLSNHLKLPEPFNKSLAYQLHRYAHKNITLPPLPGVRALTKIPTEIELATVLMALITGSFQGVNLYIRSSEWFVLDAHVAYGALVTWQKLMQRCPSFQQFFATALSTALKLLLDQQTPSTGSSSHSYGLGSFSVIMQVLAFAYQASNEAITSQLTADGVSLGLLHEQLTKTLSLHMPCISSCGKLASLYRQLCSTQLKILKASGQAPAPLIALHLVYTMTEEMEQMLADVTESESKIESVKFAYEFDSRFPFITKSSFLALQKQLVDYIAISLASDQVKQVAVSLLDLLIAGHHNWQFTFDNYTTLHERVIAKITELPATEISVSVLSRLLKVSTIYTLHYMSRAQHDDDRLTAGKNVLLMLVQMLSEMHGVQAQLRATTALSASWSTLRLCEAHWYHELFFDIMTIALTKTKIVDLNTHMTTIWREYLLQLGCPELLLRWVDKYIINYEPASESGGSLSLDSLSANKKYHLLLRFLPEDLFSCHYLSQCSDGALGIVKRILTNVAGPNGESQDICLELPVFKSYYTEQYFYPRSHVRSWLPELLPTFIHPQPHASFSSFQQKDVSSVSATSSKGKANGGDSVPYLHESWLVDEGLTSMLSSVNEGHLFSMFSVHIKQLSLVDVQTPISLNLTGLFVMPKSTGSDNQSLVHLVPAARSLTSLLSFRDNLVDLTLSQCNLSELPRVVLFMKKLKRLDISKNLLQTLPSEIAQCIDALEILNISWNFFDEYPAVVKEFKQLKELYLTGNMCLAPSGK